MICFKNWVSYLYNSTTDLFAFRYAILEHELLIYLGILREYVMHVIVIYHEYHWEKKGKELKLVPLKSSTDACFPLFSSGERNHDRFEGLGNVNVAMP